MKIAIVGSGIAGMTAAYLLHAEHDLTLFEAGSYLGGPFGNPGGRQDAYTVVDLALRLRPEKGHWDVALIGKNLGGMYENGKGIGKDDIQAVALYRKACDANFAPGWWIESGARASGPAIADKNRATS